MRPFLLCLLLLTGLPAAEWPQFLGPTHDGRAADSEPALPDSLPAELKPLWEKSVGSGFAGPVVVGGRLVVFHREGGDMTTEMLDARTGQPVWRSTYVTDYVDSFGFDNGPRAVPAIAGGKVITFGPEGRVTALDLKTGKECWHYDTASELESPQGFFGRAPSPLILDDRVVVAAGGTRKGSAAGLAALDLKTGAVAWTSVEDEAGYASPVPGRKGEILAWMRNQLWRVNASDGALRASMPLRSGMDASVNAATPLPCGEDRWLVSAGYGVGAHLLRLTDAGIEEVWRKDRLLDCHYATPVRVGDHVFGFHGRQETGMKLRCISLATGEVAWECPDGLPGGTLLAVADKLLVVTEQGELWVVLASAEKFDRLAAWQILGSGHRSHAAYSDGVLYARDSERLVAVKLR
jgi:outer membrane protein assembly factor BamB